MNRFHFHFFYVVEHVNFSSSYWFDMACTAHLRPCFEWYEPSQDAIQECNWYCNNNSPALAMYGGQHLLSIHLMDR